MNKYGELNRLDKQIVEVGIKEYESRQAIEKVKSQIQSFLSSILDKVHPDLKGIDDFFNNPEI
jgi:hypothetical protein